MNNLIHADIFFFISSIGFIVVGILIIILLIKIIKITNTFARIMQKIENNIDTIGDATKEILEELKDNMLFKFLFKSRHKIRKTKIK